MTDAQPLSDENVTAFVTAWYVVLDIHAPAQECRRFLADQEFEMAYPERTLRSYGDFDDWLAGIYSTFFDEEHHVQSVTISSRTETTGDLDVVVGWQASWFTPPDAKSKRTSMNAIQRWTIQESDKNRFGLEIRRYHVDRFDYAPGFVQL